MEPDKTLVAVSVEKVEEWWVWGRRKE